MENLTDKTTITADGQYRIGTEQGESYLVAISGTFGSGTITLKFADTKTLDNWITFQDGAFTAAAEFTLIAPTNAILFDLAGSTTPSIKIFITHIK